MTHSPPLDVAALAAELTVRVDGHVGFGAGDRALYTMDASIYRQVPIGTVVPRSIEAVVETIAVCRRFGVPVLSRGGGTSLAGQTCNTAVVIDWSRHLNRIIEIDPDRQTALVEPGIVLDQLRAAAERHGLTFAPDPSTHNRCTLGGMIGNNSCGTHSLMAGKTVDNVEALEILTYAGERFWVGATTDEALEAIIAEGGERGRIHATLRTLRDEFATRIRDGFPTINRRVSGFNLDQLLPENGFHVARALVGTEGTCVTVLRARLRLVPSPAMRVLAVLGFKDIFEAGDATPAILPFAPIGLEGLDQRIVADMAKKKMPLDAVSLLPDGRGWLFVEFGSDTLERARAAAERMTTALQASSWSPSMRLFTDRAEQQRVWSVRADGGGATHSVPGEAETYPAWEDAAVDPARVGDYLRQYQALLDRYGYSSSLFGHFGDGCIHGRVTFDLESAEGVATWRAFMYEAADLVVRFGGSLSGEHGDGQVRGELLSRMFSSELLDAFRRFKRLWDPDNRMNPGKVIDPYPMDRDLRPRTALRMQTGEMRLAFAGDGGSLAKAAGRCVGLGKCRRLDGGVMCPSYKATGEERHSTRGRARLLFEMLQGQTLTDGWQSEPVREALDLCLACKGCRHECPTQVDMASYKAEFLSHYYEHRRRPRVAYSMGLIDRWARWMAWAPRLVNAALAIKSLARLARRIADIHPQRALPRLPERTFQQSFARQKTPAGGEAGDVVFWPDTFSNHFQPQVALAAVRVLEAAGYRVRLPASTLCCGRPLYDFGMLGTAHERLQHCLRILADDIDAGVPIVGLEPACVATFRDELLNMLPQDPRARRLADNTFLFSEFLVERSDWQPPRLDRKALVQMHCHHQAVLRPAAEVTLLDRLGLDYRVLAHGCCGMAGSFGYDRRHYDIAMLIGEQGVLPAVRAADPDTLIIATGYSCREQISQATDRRPLHLAQVLDLALDLTES